MVMFFLISLLFLPGALQANAKTRMAVDTANNVERWDDKVTSQPVVDNSRSISSISRGRLG